MNINSINTILNNTQYLKQQSLLSTEKLSSGLKINKASDAPSLINRINRLNSEIRGKETANNNIQDGISLIQTAESALSTMNNIGSRLSQLSVLYNSDTLANKDKEVIENESKELLKEMKNIKENTKFNGLNIFTGKDFDIQTGDKSIDKYTIKIPDLKFVSNDKENVISIDETEQTATTSSANSISAPLYTLPSISVNIPDQDGYTGYKKIYDNHNNLIYDGNLTDGKLDGFGVLYGDNGKVSYRGNFKDNVYDGYGSLYNKNGTLKYEGEISNGTQDKWGSYYTDEGVIQHIGNFKDGYREGFGTAYDSKGNQIESKDYTDYSNRIDNGGAPNNDDKDDGNTDKNNGNTDKDNTDNSIYNKILNTDYIEKNILNPISNGISNLGIQENILNYRYELNENQNNINTETLSKIQDTDIAKELLKKTKADILSQVNTSLFSNQLSEDRNYILTLLS